MQHPERSQIGKWIPLLLALMFLNLSCTEKAAPPPAGPSVSLPAVALQAFGTLPSSPPASVTPALQEPAVALDRALNYQRVLAFLGVRLTPQEKKFLEKHRFLLISKSATKFKGRVDLGWESASYDEMLGLFEEVGGASDSTQRLPENCHFVNPDVVLHAFHKYLENSLQYLEKTELAGTLKRFLTNLQAKALESRAAASGPLAEHYELIAAQLTVPLVILENAHWPSAKELEEIASEPPKVPVTDDHDTLANALKILDGFKGKLSAPVFKRMAAELRLIYEAREVKPSPLYSQYAKDGAVQADYTQFTPRSHYVKRLRSPELFPGYDVSGKEQLSPGEKRGRQRRPVAHPPPGQPGPRRPAVPAGLAATHGNHRLFCRAAG